MTQTGLAPADASPVSRVRAPGGLVLLVLSLLWLAREMWAAHASIARNLDDPAVAISSVALALPGVITASLVAGVAAGLFAALRLAARTEPATDGVADGAVDDPSETPAEPAASPWPGLAARVARRAAVTGGVGLVVGVVAAGVILVAYGATSAVRGLAITTALAALIGGALAAAPVRITRAGVAGVLVVFLTTAVLTIFQEPLKSLFGAADTVRSQSAAAGWFSLTSALVGGLAAGVTAYLCLRRAGLRWPMFLLAGAAPGLLYVVAEIITRLGGAQLLRVASGFSSWDAFAISYLGENRINFALAVGFLGGIIAMVLHGRTLKPAHEDDSEAAAQPPSTS
ncbi:hypothetical protein [Luedemannella helvata]|uniref:Uncharacterized protein n=1 Tax=Luedemannella helvata TaxID=349315 RepID=A0ABP4W265_9ACTN